MNHHGNKQVSFSYCKVKVSWSTSSSKMFRLISIVAAVYAGVGPDRKGDEIPGENGWSVTCRLLLDVPPAFTLFHNGDLFFTSFTATGNPADGVYVVRDYVKNCEDGTPELLFNNMPWPNSVQAVPESVFGKNWFSVSAGFFPQSKNDGCVAVFNLDEPDSSLTYLTPGCTHEQGEHSPFFYHKIEWVDMDGDGKLDVVTARCINDGPIEPIDQTLLWIENPNNEVPSASNPWPLHEIGAVNHADVFFNVAELARPSGTGTQIVIAVGSFYGQKLELVWTEDANDNWNNVALQKSVEIDTAGWYFDVHFDDINGDGKLDLMSTTWSRSDETGQSIGYELNGLDWRLPTSWIRHTIFDRFPRFLNAGFGAPGGFSFGGPATPANTKQVIYVSGDDDGRVYRHTPVSDNVNQWRYETDTIYQTDPDVGYATLTGATIGEITAMDINGDDSTDIILPNYTLKQIIVLEQNGAHPGPPQ